MKNIHLLHYSSFLLLIIISFYCNDLCSQISQRTNESSDLPINPATGVQNTSIPLYSISDYDIVHNIALQYNGGGILAEQVSDWVGLGWSLNAGGYVQRMVRGLPDDDYSKGYYFHHGDIGGDELGVAEGEYDTEPDLYSVVFNGRVGQFFFDDGGNIIWKNMERFIMEPVWPDVGDGIKYWKLTDDFGNKYLFGWDHTTYYWHEEVTFLTSDNNAVSSRIKLKWFLTKMTTAQGHLIKYTYSPEEYRVWNINNHSYTIRAGMTPLEYQQDEDIMYNLIGRDIVTHRLQEIEYPNYKVVFNALFSRSDVDIYSDLDKYDLNYEPRPPKALTNIKVTNKHNNACTNDIWLDHEYSIATIDQFENEESWIPEMTGSHYPDKLRMFLNSVSFMPCQDASGSCEVDANSIVFDYYSRDILCRRITYAQDLWGYSNGATDNTTLIPSWQVGGDLPMVAIDAADRDPDLTYSQAGALKSVEYPTGLKTEFQYELNEALLQRSSTKSYQIFHDDVCVVNPCFGSCTAAESIVIEDIHFNELFDLQLDISISQTICSGSNAVVGVKIYKRYGAGSWALEHQIGFEATEEHDGSNWSACGDELKELLSIEFEEVVDLKFEAESFGFNIAQMWVKAIYNDQDKYPEPRNVPVGGIADKKIITNDLTRSYDYFMEEGNFPVSESSQIIDWGYWSYATLPCPGSYQPETQTIKIGSFTFNSLMEISAELGLNVLGEQSCISLLDDVQVLAQRNTVSDAIHQIVLYENIAQVGTYELSHTDLIEKGLIPGFEYDIYVHHPTERVIIDIEFFVETVVPTLDPSKKWSSGQITNFPLVAEAYYTDVYFNESELVYELHTKSPIISNLGGHVLYSNVTEHLNDGELGYSTHFFQPTDYRDISHFHLVPVSGCIPVVTELPLRTFINFKPLTGQAIRSKVFDEQENLNRSSSFEYRIEEDIYEHDVYQNITFFQTYSVEVLYPLNWLQFLEYLPPIGSPLNIVSDVLSGWLGGNTTFIDIDGVQIIPYHRETAIHSTFSGINKSTVEELGVSLITEFVYRGDLAHLNPIEIKQSVEGDGEERVTKIFYAHDAGISELTDDEVNFVSAPIYTLIDGGQGGGSKTDFDIIGGRVLPIASYRAMNNGTTWKEMSRADINTFTNDGLPSDIYRYNTGLAEEYLYYNANDNPHLTGLIKEVWYDQRKTTYSYYPNRLLQSTTNHEGITTGYTYDGLNRVCNQLSNNGRVTTDYTYTLAAQPGELNKVTSTTSFLNENGCTEATYNLPDWITDSYSDAYGRSTKVVRLDYTQSGEDFATGNTYDPLGKVLEDCNPNKGGCDTYDYSPSPLRRLVGVQPAGSSKWILIDHGSNDAGVGLGSISYPAHTLYKTSITDENGIVTERYTNFKGLMVMERRDAGGSEEQETYYRYDKRNNILEVYPPGSAQDNDDVNFIYDYYNDGTKDGLLWKKHVPDEALTPGEHGIYQYDYNTREQLTSESMPNGHTLTYFFNEPYFDFLETVKLDNEPIRSYLPVDEDIYTWVENESVQVVDGANEYDLATSYDHDDLGRVLSETRGFIGATSTYTYCYDDANNVRFVSRIHDFPADEKNDISFNYIYDMSNGVRVDAVHLNLGGLDKLSEFTYDNNDWLVADKVGDGLHTIGYDYNGRGWLEKINSVAPPPPGILDDCDPDQNPIPPTYVPYCIEVGNIIKILYDCAALAEGDPTTVILSVQNGDLNQNTPIALNGSDGTETDQTDSIDLVISSEGDIAMIESILQSILADCFTISEGSIKAEYDLNALIAKILSKFAGEGGDLFGEHIHYFKGNQDLEAPPQWNGNVSWTEWRIAGEPYQAYGFQYDGLNRLTQAIYQSKITLCEITDANYDCFFGYDARGNINSITRYGFKGLSSTGVPQYDIIDNLSFSAQGANMVRGVEDSADPNRGFLGTEAEYVNSYGRLDQDMGVKAARITSYNFLNQPVNIEMGTKPAYKHAYDAYGNMLKQTTYDANEEDYDRLYHDGIEYFNGQLEAVYHSEGRFVFERFEDGSIKRMYHEFMIRDHLGNIRVRFADLNADKKINIVDKGPGQPKEILGSYHYYPYGMKMEGIFHKQNLLNNSYQYNGIDYLSNGSLNVNFATWRTLDPAIGRWWQSDPLSEEYYSWSPFNSMNGSPMVNADPYGATIWPGLGNAISNFISNVNTWGHILPEVVITAAKPAYTFAAAHELWSAMRIFDLLTNPASQYAIAPPPSASFSAVQPSLWDRMRDSRNILFGSQFQTGYGIANSFYQVAQWPFTPSGGKVHGLSWKDTYIKGSEAGLTTATFQYAGVMSTPLMGSTMGVIRPVTARTSTQGVNRIYSARELMRRSAEPGPFHNFPESFNKVIFEQGTQTITHNYFNVAKPGLSNSNILYRLSGNINGKQGFFEIAVRPSLSGRTEVIMHRFFNPIR